MHNRNGRALGREIGNHVAAGVNTGEHEALFALRQLGFDAQSGVRHRAKALLGNQLFGDAANTVGLISMRIKAACNPVMNLRKRSALFMSSSNDCTVEPSSSA